MTEISEQTDNEKGDPEEASIQDNQKNPTAAPLPTATVKQFSIPNMINIKRLSKPSKKKAMQCASIFAAPTTWVMTRGHCPHLCLLSDSK